jgi:imidazolonepropionase-like amidohydrolase
MKASGVVFDPTNYVYALVERMRASIPDDQFKPPIYCSSDTSIRITRQAYRAGVTMAVGTDAPAPPEAAYPSLHDEMETLANKVGMKPMHVIVAATRNGARALGHEAEMGTIAPGKLANLVFLEADPLDDIAATRKVALTVKRGHEYWRRDYRPPPPEDLDPSR